MLPPHIRAHEELGRRWLNPAVDDRAGGESQLPLPGVRLRYEEREDIFRPEDDEERMRARLDAGHLVEGWVHGCGCVALLDVEREASLFVDVQRHEFVLVFDFRKHLKKV